MSVLDGLIPVLYVRISPDRLSVTNAKSGETISEPPELAIAGTPAKVIGAGAQARAAAALQGGNVINPFMHPRTLISDFTVAEQLVKAFVKRMSGRHLFTPSPRVVIHPLGDPAGGFTQVERRAFREMALGAGGSSVVVWSGRELSNEEVLSSRFPAGEGVAG